MMLKYFKVIFLCALVCAVAGSCRKKAFDEYYGRPESLADPIYQQLQSKGKFKSFLTCIDKAGYKDILSAAGYWTLFAPNDSAFQVYFRERGIADANQLDSVTANQIVTFSLVYNAFTTTRLPDYQSATGWMPNFAFRRRTANYLGFYTDTIKANALNKSVTTISANRNVGYVFGDNNNKYLTYFTDRFMSANGLNASDYNYFYPGVNYTGFNVFDAAAVSTDIVAENGYIHEINRVLVPPPSIDRYLATRQDYSHFRQIFDDFMVTFSPSNDATNRYKILTGRNDSVYIKFYNPALGFWPNNENYLKQQDNDGQAGAYTMFAPNNAALDNYVRTVLLENYRSLKEMPIQIIIDFLNAHMWQAPVWPRKFANTNNVQAEPARFDPNADIIEKKMLSNGIFYGTNKVQVANVFSTVYGRAYLDPKYLLMTRALDQSIRYNITVPTLRYAMFMISDSVFRAKGYDYNFAQSQWQYTPPGSTTPTVSTAVRDNIQRILALNIVPVSGNELSSLNGSGIVETFNGEYIKYNNNTVESGGTRNNGPAPAISRVTGSKPALNGTVYYNDNLIAYDTTSIGNTISTLGATTASNFYNFAQFLRNSALYATTTSKVVEITGVTPGVFYTVFVPTNAAVLAAVNAGLLPKLANGTPNFAPTLQAERDLVTNFIQFHIINKNTIVTDGKKTGSFETLYKKLSGDVTQLVVSGGAGSMQLRDNFERVSNVVISSSNNLANRCVIHQIDNYLQYNPK